MAAFAYRELHPESLEHLQMLRVRQLGSVNPFQTHQQAEAYLSRVTDPVGRGDTRVRLGFESKTTTSEAVFGAMPPVTHVREAEEPCRSPQVNRIKAVNLLYVLLIAS